jgi:hypothetical protein
MQQNYSEVAALENSNVAAVREAIFDLFMVVHYQGVVLTFEERDNFRK